jgi:hypothetical protein
MCSRCAITAGGSFSMTISGPVDSIVPRLILRQGIWSMSSSSRKDLSLVKRVTYSVGEIFPSSSNLLAFDGMGLPRNRERTKVIQKNNRGRSEKQSNIQKRLEPSRNKTNSLLYVFSCRQRRRRRRRGRRARGFRSISNMRATLQILRAALCC